MTYGELRQVPAADLSHVTSNLNLRLWCPCCEESYSAQPGDYWDRDDDELIRCVSCLDAIGASEPLELMAERTVMVPYVRLEEWRRMMDAWRGAE